MKINLIKDTTKLLLIFLCAAFVLVGDGFGQKTAANFYAHLKPEHQLAVKNYIGDKANLRPAQTSDCKNKFGLDSFRQNNDKAAHPYYSVADFDKDGADDFAVVLYDSKQAANVRFTVLIFKGAKSGSYKMSFKSANMDLRQGGIWTDGFGAEEGKTTLTAGVFETDDAIWIEWSGGKYVAHDADSEN